MKRAPWLSRLGRALRRAAVVAVAALVFGGAAYGAGPAWQAVRTHPYFAVSRVEVRGAGPLLDAEEVRSWLRIAAGTSVWDIDTAAAEARLRAHPFIDRAAARRIFPHRFAVVVHEREPQALLLLDDFFYVDRRGETFGPLAPEHERDFPVITGVRDDDPPGYRKWALRRALHLLRRCERHGCPLPVSEIHLDPTRGVVLYPREPAVPVVLGWRGWGARIDRAARVLDSWQGATDHLASVDARFRDQVVVTLRERGTAVAGAAKKGGMRI